MGFRGRHREDVLPGNILERVKDVVLIFRPRRGTRPTPAGAAGPPGRAREAKVPEEPRLCKPAQRLPWASLSHERSSCFSWKTERGLEDSNKSHPGAPCRGAPLGVPSRP